MLYVYHVFWCVDCETAMRKIQEQYDILLKLPINSILGSLFSKNVITLNDKKLLETKPLESDRVTYVLDDVLLGSLSVNVMDKYINFVGVLKQRGEDDDDVVLQKLAKDLGMH